MPAPHFRDMPRSSSEQSMSIQRRITLATLLLAPLACTSGTDRAAARDSVAARPGAASDTRPSIPSTPPAMSPANDSAVTEHGIGLLKKDYLSYTRSPAELELLRALKRTLDPNGILNPGKILDA
jgi:hypothetical protein